MNNNIKEILECLEKYGQLTPDAIDDLHYIRDYTTNLQEENESYLRRLDEAYEREDTYKQRIEKAIEKINCLIEVEKKETNYDRFYSDSDYEIKKLNDIKNTLQGSDKNE